MIQMLFPALLNSMKWDPMEILVFAKLYSNSNLSSPFRLEAAEPLL